MPYIGQERKWKHLFDKLKPIWEVKSEKETLRRCDVNCFNSTCRRIIDAIMNTHLTNESSALIQKSWPYCWKEASLF